MDQLYDYILPGINSLARSDGEYQDLLQDLESEKLRYQYTLDKLPLDDQFAIEDYIDKYVKLLMRSIYHAFCLGKLQNEIEKAGRS